MQVEFAFCLVHCISHQLVHICSGLVLLSKLTFLCVSWLRKRMNFVCAWGMGKRLLISKLVRKFNSFDLNLFFYYISMQVEWNIYRFPWHVRGLFSCTGSCKKETRNASFWCSGITYVLSIHYQIIQCHWLTLKTIDFSKNKIAKLLDCIFNKCHFFPFFFFGWTRRFKLEAQCLNEGINLFMIFVESSKCILLRSHGIVSLDYWRGCASWWFYCWNEDWWRKDPCFNFSCLSECLDWWRGPQWDFHQDNKFSFS